jgi:gluconokinase
MEIHGLRSPYEPVEGLVYFARMIDKIRLHAAGLLPSEYQPLLGNANPRSFDARCCRFLQIDFTALAAIALQGGTDTAIFQWACAHGRKPSEKDVEVWNAFMQKRGWRDESSSRLRERVLESGIEDRVVSTFFDYFDADEGRPARFPDDPTPSGEPVTGGDRIPGLRSPRDKVGGVFHFGRMLDKIRLFHQGKLPQGWIESKGLPNGLDGTCCGFLEVDYKALEAETVKGRGDDQMLQWAFVNGRQSANEEVEIWNDYLSKRCWRDRYTPRLHTRLQEAGWPIGTVLTMFDFVDLDEGRTSGSRQPIN